MTETEVLRWLSLTRGPWELTGRGGLAGGIRGPDGCPLTAIAALLGYGRFPATYVGKVAVYLEIPKGLLDRIVATADGYWREWVYDPELRLRLLRACGLIEAPPASSPPGEGDLQARAESPSGVQHALVE